MSSEMMLSAAQPRVRSSLVLALTLGSLLACDEVVSDRGVERQDRDTNDSGPSIPSSVNELKDRPPLPTPQVTGQITVLDTDELDVEDPSELQIPATEKDKEFIIAGGAYILANAEVQTTPASAVRVAQRMMADVARADHVVLAEVLGETAPKGNPAKVTLTLKTLDVVKGSADPNWTLEYPALSGSCGIIRPHPGSEALFFLGDQTGELLPQHNGGVHRVIAGLIQGYPGVLANAELLKAGVAKGMEVKP